MSVKTSTFGCVTLKGKEAEKFRNQFTHGRPKKAAHDAAARGKTMRAEYKKTGRVTISVQETD